VNHFRDVMRAPQTERHQGSIFIYFMCSSLKTLSLKLGGIWDETSWHILSYPIVFLEEMKKGTKTLC